MEVNEQMKRVLLVLVLLLAACGQAQPAAEPTAAPAGNAAAPAAVAGDGVDRSRLASELYFFNWSEYINPELLEEFEQEYGVRVIVDVYDSNETMLPRIRAGNSGYDIVAPSDYAVKIMLQDGLLAELDKSLLPNMQYLNPNNLDAYFDPENVYSVPYFWGTTGIAYNKTVFDEPPDSWSLLFDPAQAADIGGRFTMLDDPRETPAAALIYQGQSVNATDPATLAAAEELLVAQKDLVSAYDSSNVNLKLATEEIVAAHAWNGMAATALLGIEDKPGNPNIGFVIPQEGGVIWQDNLAIVADSPNQYTAHVFINFLLDPEVAARNADWVLYLTPNEAARELLAEETLELYASGIEPDAETIARLQWIERNEETDLAFNDLWTQVRGQ